MANDELSNHKKTDEAEEFNQLKKELEEFKQKSEDYLNAWKRSAADFENYKKRREQEDRELAQFSREVTVVKVLPVLESLEAALKQAPERDEYKNWSDGVIKIVQQLEKMLLELGVEKIEAEGKIFDPNLHEALEEVESDNHDPGMVIEEIQKGYKLNEKVIRPAKVKVAKRKE